MTHAIAPLVCLFHYFMAAGLTYKFGPAWVRGGRRTRTVAGIVTTTTLVANFIATILLLEVAAGVMYINGLIPDDDFLAKHLNVFLFLQLPALTVTFLTVTQLLTHPPNQAPRNND